MPSDGDGVADEKGEQSRLTDITHAHHAIASEDPGCSGRQLQRAKRSVGILNLIPELGSNHETNSRQRYSWLPEIGLSKH